MLIALAIIGVVAAITIPTLQESLNEQETVAKVKKAYNTLSNAQEMAEAENGPIATLANDNSSLAIPIVKNLNTVKICGIEAGKGCYNNIAHNINGTSIGNLDNGNDYKIKLSNNMFFTFHLSYPNCTGEKGSMKNYCGYVFLDINGDVAPNVLGKDIQDFLIFSSGIHPSGGSYCGEECGNDTFSVCVVTGTGCTAWIVYNGNMDYLKCPDDLSWAGNRKCP